MEQAAGHLAQDPSGWSQFGLGGLVIAALFWLVRDMIKESRESRKEWIDCFLKIGESVSHLTVSIEKLLEHNRNGGSS